MSDLLKEYINNNREGFDDLQPGDLWAGIDQTLTQHSYDLNQESNSGGYQGKSASSKKLKTMFKYGFGASALILGTFLIVNSQKEKSATLSGNTKIESKTISPIKDKSESTMPPAPKDATRENKSMLLLNTNVDSVPENYKTENIQLKDSAKEETASVQKVKPSYFIARVPGQDSLRSGNSTYIDTLFTGIKKLKVKVDYCDVTIKAVAGDEVSVHGKIDPNTGSFIILGRTAFKKTEPKLKFEKKDSVLTVWMVYIKIHTKMAAKDIKSKGSTIDFEVPVNIEVEVNNTSGDLSLKGLQNKSMMLQTSFGNIKAENISSDLLLRASSGDINLSNITGSIKATSSFGNLVINKVTGSLSASASSGNITVTQVKGNVSLLSSFGSQCCDNVTGDLVANVSSGNINIKQLKGNINARSSFGKQNYANIEGDLLSTASSGDIIIAGLTGMLNLGTSFGNISGKDITLLNRGDFKTSSGNIQVNLLNEMKDLSFDLKSSSGKLLIEKNNSKNSSEETLQLGDGSIVVKGISSFGNQIYK